MVVERRYYDYWIAREAKEEQNLDQEDVKVESILDKEYRTAQNTALGVEESVCHPRYNDKLEENSSS